LTQFHTGTIHVELPGCDASLNVLSLRLLLSSLLYAISRTWS
jgi:hypothetical protein